MTARPFAQRTDREQGTFNVLFDVHRKEKTIDNLNHDDIIFDSDNLIVEEIIKNEIRCA